MGLFGKLFGKQTTGTDAQSMPPGPHLSAPGAALQPAPSSRLEVPSDWGWCWLHARSPRLKALGYYYRDSDAGTTLNVLVDLASTLDPTQIRIQAASRNYRGATTFRIGPHESINVEGQSENFAALMRKKYELCESVAGTVVLKLTAAERAQYGLPEMPKWLVSYL